ncbi:MAG: RagB/SusD family nutrient uptake outer membrane protein [Candidatus Symbiothrix sp.]|jgi:hypothetical protein|nr:RagB/SusD family nutrient uptake outer membrane protein [Candidatus Symbiothrix sp.]
MKRIYFVLLSALLMCACTDFLEEKPRTVLSPDMAYETEEGLGYGTNGLYDRLASVYFHDNDFGRIFGLWMAPSDIHHSRQGEDGYRFGKCDALDITSESGEVSYLWNYYYKIVTNAQLIITKSEELEWKDSKLENRVKGEAYFFHAYGHFYLTQFFGDIPIVDKIYDEIKINWERNPKSQVMELVINDLLKAKDYLAWEPYENPMSLKIQNGRITKGTALHLLAYAYLCNQDWPNAEKYGKEAIESGHYQLMKTRFGSQIAHADGNPFWDLFQLNNQDWTAGNTEGLLVIQNEPYELLPQIVDGDVIDKTGLYERHVRFFYNVWYEGVSGIDSKSDVMLEYGGRGKAYILASPYWIDNLFTDAADVRGKFPCVQKVFKNPLLNDRLLCDWDALTEAEKVDSRKGIRYRPYPTKWSWDGESRAGSWFADATTRDIYVFRLAETYLIVAEALHQRGNNSETDGAAWYINQVRERAGATPITASDVSIDYILDERARELYGEIPRKLDLWRTGKFFERVQAYSPNPARLSMESPKHLTLPIPQEIIDLNIEKFMPQNEGWGATTAQ